MSADTCQRCGRERGWGSTQCSPRDHESCIGFLRDRAERERDEARADVDRLRAERDELRAQLQRLTDDAYEVDHRGNYSEPPIEFGPVPLCGRGHRQMIDSSFRERDCERCAKLRKLADDAASEMGLAQHRMMQAQEARDVAHAAGATEERARNVALLKQWAADVSDETTKGVLLIAAYGIERGKT